MKQQTSTRLFTSFIFLLFTGCPDNGVVPPDRPSFSLSVEEVVSTEALIKIEYALSDSITVQLKRNGQVIAQNLRMSKEFVFNDTLLQPKQNYTFVAVKIENGKAVDSTSSLHITTMDTTSHNFVWETYFFGDPSTSSSSLNDIAIVNDTLIYAVGEIYKKDSSGQSEIAYGLTIWDGEIWKQRALYYTTSSNNIINFSNIRGIFYSDSIEIWFAGGSLFRWDRHSDQVQLIYSRLDLPDPNSSIEKISVISKNKLFAVGNTGTVLYKTNNVWQKLESGTRNDINDVWGVLSSKTNNTEVYCATFDNINPNNSTILKIINTVVVDSMSSTTGRGGNSVWTANGKTFYAAGGGLWKYFQGRWKQIDIGPNATPLRIRGNASNDIIAVGVLGLVAHYNGKDWYYYPELNSASYYSSVSIKDNLVAMVGSVNGRPVVTIGKRP